MHALPMSVPCSLAVTRRPNRFRTTALIRRLVSNPMIESGLTALEISKSVSPDIPAKSIARLELSPPQSVSRAQLKMAVRFAQSQSTVDAADILAIIRDPARYRSHPFREVLAAQIYRPATKEERDLAKRIQTLAATAQRICIFDRADNFPYLRADESDDVELQNSESNPPDVSASAWLADPAGLHYVRHPRVFVTLTVGSLAERKFRNGDPALERLIGGLESGEFGVTIVDADVRREHRMCRGVFANATAVIIFDHGAMVVLPKHGRSIRLYEFQADDAGLIREAIRDFGHMRKFRMHAPTRFGVVSILRQHMSYQLPWWLTPCSPKMCAACN